MTVPLVPPLEPPLDDASSAPREEFAAVTARYRAALDILVKRLEADRYVIAAILCGSLSHDQVWEKSDIDLLIIGTEEFKKSKDYSLVEDGINIHAMIRPRSEFRQSLESALQSSFHHSLFSKSALLFSKDETITEYYHNVNRIGARDREIQLLVAGSGVLPVLAKAEKWHYVKRDVAYTFKWLLYCVDPLASIEALLHGEVTGREVILQALRLNPDFFHRIYTDLIHGEKTPQTLQAALDAVNEYLDEKRFIFNPVLDYLSKAGGLRSTTELDAHFQKVAGVGYLAFVYEWLADKEIIQKVPAPLRLTEKSRVTVNEAAYYYDGDERGPA